MTTSTPAAKSASATPAACTTSASADTHDRVRTDPASKVTLRVNGTLHHIGTGHEHARTRS